MAPKPTRTSLRNDLPTLVAWSIIILVTALLTTQSIHAALDRYHNLRSGWSWDLAYYNQWCWAITHGNHTISVRPIADYATEGPSVWKTNYLAPIRYAILPLYRLWPDPKTLLIVHAIIFWWVVPAAFALVRFETRANLPALVAAALVAVTPLLLPLAANDFRELQLGLPFVLIATHGVRARSIVLTLGGIAGVLACRQEYALFVASLAILPPRAPASIVSRDRWARVLWFTGVVWLTVVFFGFLVAVSGWYTPAEYLNQFLGPKPTLVETLLTASKIMLFGLGAWALLALAAPRAFLISLPWLWSLAGGRWGMHMLSTPAWHHVRYTAPYVGTALAAGLLGASRLWRFAARLPNPASWRAVGCAAALVAMVWTHQQIEIQFASVPFSIPQSEAEQIWPFIRQVGPTEGVLAHYDLAAPLSSRSLLVSYVMKQNQPPGFPGRLPDAISWVFFLNGDIETQELTKQGFKPVFEGSRVRVFRRPTKNP